MRPGGGAERRAVAGQHLGERLGQRGRVAGRGESAGHAVLDGGAHPADVGGDDRQSGQPGLDQHAGHALAVAGEQQRVGGPVERRGVGEVAEEVCAGGVVAALQPGPQRAVPGHRQPDVGEPADGVQGEVEALLGGDRPDPGDQQAVGRQAEGEPGRTPVGGVPGWRVAVGGAAVGDGAHHGAGEPEAVEQHGPGLVREGGDGCGAPQQRAGAHAAGGARGPVPGVADADVDERRAGTGQREGARWQGAGAVRDDDVGGAGGGAQRAQGPEVQPGGAEDGGAGGAGRCALVRGVRVRGERAQGGGLAPAAQLQVEVAGEVLRAAAARIGDDVQDPRAGSGGQGGRCVVHGTDLGTGCRGRTAGSQ